MPDTTFLHHLRDEIDAEIKAQETIVTGGGGTGTLTLIPASAKPGDLVTITGRGFGTTGAVSTGYYPNTPVSWADDLIVSRLHPDIPPGIYNVYINLAWLGLSIEVLAADDTGDNTPTITSVSPLMGDNTTLVTVAGTNLGTSGVVTIGDIQADIVSWSVSSITLHPAEYIDPLTGTTAGYGGHVVVMPSGSPVVASAATFTYVLPTTGGGSDDLSDDVDTGFAMRIISPVRTRESNLVFHVDPNNPFSQLINAAVEQEVIDVSQPVHFTVDTAGGMQNQEVHTEDGMILRSVPDAKGNVVNRALPSIGPLKENGPFVLDSLAWDGPAGGSYQNQLKQRAVSIIRGGRESVFNPAPGHSQGLTLAFDEDFSNFNLGPNSPWAAIYPQSFGRGQFGDAFYVDPTLNNNEGPNPFRVVDRHLEIRSTLNSAFPGYNYPPGYQWSGGIITLGRVGGVEGIYWAPPFSLESIMMCPTGVTPWPANWMLLRSGLVPGAINNIEIDINENLGNFPPFVRSAIHHYHENIHDAWAFPGGEQGFQFNNIPGGVPDSNNYRFHKYAVRVESTKVDLWLDDVYISSLPMPPEPNPEFFLMIDHARGAGWPEAASAAKYESVWIKRVRVWR